MSKLAKQWVRAPRTVYSDPYFYRINVEGTIEVACIEKRLDFRTGTIIYSYSEHEAGINYESDIAAKAAVDLVLIRSGYCFVSERLAHML